MKRAGDLEIEIRAVVPSWRRVYCALLGLMALTSACRSTWAADGQTTAAAAKSAVIHLTNGDVASGQLMDSPTAEALLWRSAPFNDAFRFPIGAVEGIRFPTPQKLPTVEAEYCFELTGGDIIFGALIAWEGESLVVDAPELGRLHIQNKLLRRLYRWRTSELIYIGPDGLDKWQSTDKDRSWREEGGSLVTDKPGTIRRDFSAPAQARFEMDLSWTKKPDFQIALGAAFDPTNVARAFHIEVWEDEIVAVRETESEADVVSVQTVKSGPGRLSLQVFLDQEKERMLIFSSHGEQLADLSVKAATPQTFGGLRIANKTGDLRLEGLRIGKWNAEVPRVVEGDKARIMSLDGAVTYGQIKSYDAEKHQFVVVAETGESRVDEKQIQDVFLSQSGDETPRGLRALLFSGGRISGDLQKIEGNKLTLKSPGIEEPLAVSLDAVQALAIVKREFEAPKLTGRQGRLEVAGIVLHGSLMDGVEADGSCLIWQPASSTTAARLDRGVAARIVYRDPPAPAPPVTRSAVVRNPRIALPSAAKVAKPKFKSQIRKPVLHLRSGDIIPCVVTSIDEKGITLKMELADATFVPHDEIKALELAPNVAAATITRPKKDRLLTLPRMQRDNPPTQLIRSLEGDYLRGQVLSMDDKEIQVEVRLETKTIKRDTVARIIWLHPDELDATPATTTSPEEPTGTRLQAIPRNGDRLTFYAEKVKHSVISGKSSLLGGCAIDIDDVDLILTGKAIEEAAATLAFHQWKMKGAIDPLAPTEEGSSEDADGLASPLVGKPAPAIELKLLDGKKFQLADYKDKILVLDFWASWCSPCLQVMPQIDKVTREFAAQNVVLVAVNLQEDAVSIKGALERLELDMPVALDSEGLVAEKYGATAIPQTVIIGRDGKVARLYVGGGPRFGAILRTVLQGMTGEPTANRVETPLEKSSP